MTISRRHFIAGVSGVVGAGPSAFAAAPSGFVPDGYHLTFADDFDDPDVSRINEDAVGGRPGAPAWRSRYRHDRHTIINGEKQIYVDRAYRGSASNPLGLQPFSIAGGVLTITAMPVDERVASFVGKQRYQSGCITTELTHWQQYGYFEMRARMPKGRGFWPAFWLLPKSAAWPPEIDVVEATGAKPSDVHLGVVEKQRGRPGSRWVKDVIDTTDGFHVYAAEWTADDVVFSIDGKEQFRAGSHRIHEPMYMLVNLAIGSKDPGWIPDPDASTPWPGLLQVDYVRAYSRG
jgi:beta-glucanase (GH16 family)